MFYQNKHMYDYYKALKAAFQWHTLYWWIEQPQPRYNRIKTHNRKTATTYRCTFYNRNRIWPENREVAVVRTENIKIILFRDSICVVLLPCYTFSATYSYMLRELWIFAKSLSFSKNEVTLFDIVYWVNELL